MSTAVKPIGIVRHLADHLTPVCNTSRFYNYAFVTLLYRLCYDGPFSMKSCPKSFLYMLSFYEKDEVAGIFPFYFFVQGSDMWQRLVHSTRIFRHLHLLVLHCFVIARHAHCCIPCPPNRDCSRNTSFTHTVRTTPIRCGLCLLPQPRRHSLPKFFFIKAISAHSCHSGHKR